MASGRSNKIVGQTGEYLVAAELGRRGLIATTFTGNVPHYDIIASDEHGRHVSVQVKTVRGSIWQFADIGHYCDIRFRGNTQIVGRAKKCPVRDLVVVFVKLDDDGADRFYILPWVKLRDRLVRRHKQYLQKHNGVRPQRWDSKHTAISEKDLAPYQDKWETIAANIR